MYARSLIEVGKLIYLIGNYNETVQVKKILETSDGKSKILYKCYEEVPTTTLRKIKYENIREGIVRADWISKMIDRYPEMVIFLYNCGDDTLEMERIQVILRDILKKINLFYADLLKPSNKEDVIIKIIVTTTKAQFANAELLTKINYYLKTYEKDVFVIQNELLNRELTKYRNSWLGYLEKNYDKKYKKIIKNLEEANSIEKRICYSFKLALFSQIISRDEKAQYANAYNIIKYKFAEITKKEFNFLKYLQIRQIRVIADTIMLRYIKFKIGNNIKELPEFVSSHLNFFKMRSMEPSSCHFYYYYQELLWRSTLIQNLLEVFYSSEIMELLPHVMLAQLINGLLSYLHKMSTLSPSILNDINGKVLQMGDQIYLGKLNYLDITDSDLVMTGMSFILAHKKDYINKGIQIITRYKTLRLFKENQINFLNIYLIRFYLAQGKFSSIISIYHQILKIELNRCNYFLINELFNEIKSEMAKIDNSSKVLLYGVASLICDFFQNKVELINHLKQFFELLKYEKHDTFQQQANSLFGKQFAPQAHIFKLKKSSSIFTAKITINEQILLSEAKFNVKIKLTLNQQLRRRLASQQNKLQLKFNQHNMLVEVPMKIRESDGEIVEREFIIQPLQHVRKDAVLKIESVQLVMENKNLVWMIQRNQIVFERFDSTLLFCKIEEPQIIIQSINKIYYINEAAHFYVTIKGIQGCKITSKLSVYEQNEGNTEFFMNIKDKKDLTNSKLLQDLIVSTDPLSINKNRCWIKCNKLGSKTLKLHFSNTVEKSIKVGWREKPLTLKSTYNTVKEVNFNVTNLFTVTKIFREAQTGNLFDNNIPINKKTLLSFYIKTNQNVMIKELGLHNNPRKIIYYKNIKMVNTKLVPEQNLKVNLLFQIDQSCQNQFQLFLTTLIIKWSRLNSENPVQNVFLDEQIKINAVNDKILIAFEQTHELIKRKKSNLSIKLQNLTKQNITVRAVMDSTDSLYRIGQKSKVIVLSSKEAALLNFQVLAIHTGIFDFPPVKIFVNDIESKTSTSNFLVFCK